MPILLVPQSAVAGTYQPPTFVSEFETVFNTATSPKSINVTTLAGDRVVVYAIAEDGSNTLNTPTGNSLTYNLEQSIVVASFTSIYVWTATDAVGGTNWPLQIARSAGSGWWGFNVLVFRNSDGIGASAKTNIASGAPSLNLLTTQDASAIVEANGDWSAQDGVSRVWRTINSITPTSGNGLEQTYFRDAAHYAAYGAYWNNVGAIGTKTAGLSAPAAQKYSTVVLEVKGHFVSGGGLSGVIGQAAETDVANLINRVKTRIIGAAVEADLSLNVNRLKTRTISSALETDASQLIARRKSRSVGQSIETDASQTVNRLKTRSVSNAVESDAASSVARLKSRQLAVAVELDVSQTVNRRKTKLIASSTELDAAQLVRAVKFHTVNSAIELDLSQAVPRRKTRSILSATETDLAAGVGRRKTLIIGQAVEIDLAQPFESVGLSGIIGRATEVDLAQSVGRRKTRVVGVAIETDLAQLIARRKSRLIVPANENDLAQSIVRNKRRLILSATEIDQSFGVGRFKKLLILPAFEFDLAFDLVIPVTEFPPSVTTISLDRNRTTIIVVTGDELTVMTNRTELELDPNETEIIDD